MVEFLIALSVCLPPQAPSTPMPKQAPTVRDVNDAAYAAAIKRALDEGKHLFVYVNQTKREHSGAIVLELWYPDSSRIEVVQGYPMNGRMFLREVSPIRAIPFLRQGAPQFCPT